MVIDRSGEFAIRWHERAMLISSRPDVLDARLNRAFSPDPRFLLVNVAHRESLEAFKAASGEAEF